MSLVKMTAVIRCDECDKRWEVDVDTGFKGNPVDSLLESLHNFGEGSFEDGQYFCPECTTKRDSQWIKDHPTFISGVRENANGWDISMYDSDDVWHFVPANHPLGKPQFDKDARDWLNG